MKKSYLALIWLFFISSFLQLGTPLRAEVLRKSIYNHAYENISGWFSNGNIAKTIKQLNSAKESLLSKRIELNRQMVSEAEHLLTQVTRETTEMTPSGIFTLPSRIFNYCRQQFPCWWTQKEKATQQENLFTRLAKAFTKEGLTPQLSKQFQEIQNKIVTNNGFIEYLPKLQGKNKELLEFISDNKSTIDRIFSQGGPQTGHEEVVGKALVGLLEKTHDDVADAATSITGSITTVNDLANDHPGLVKNTSELNAIKNQLDPSWTSWISRQCMRPIKTCWALMRYYSKQAFEGYTNPDNTMTVAASVIALFSLYKLYKEFKTPPLAIGRGIGGAPAFVGVVPGAQRQLYLNRLKWAAAFIFSAIPAACGIKNMIRGT